MAAFTESCFKNSIMVALTLVLLGMCCKTVKIFLDGGTVREVTIKVRDRLPGPSVTICPLSEKGVLNEDFLDWEEYPKNIMDAYRITIIDMMSNPMDVESSSNDIFSHLDGSRKVRVLLPCKTLNLGIKGSGLNDAVIFQTKSSGASALYVCLHGKNQYVPGWNSLFDTHCLYLPSLSNQVASKEYELMITETHQLDTLDNPCASRGPSGGKMCVIHSIQRLMGCRIKVLSNNVSSLAHLPLCRTKDRMSEYANILYNMTNKSPRSLYALTGCRATCSRNKWTPVLTGQSFRPSDNGSSMSMFLYFPSGSYTIEREILVHNWENVVAEFGGYLGLLLGTSIFSMICWLWKSIKKRAFKTSKISLICGSC